jgi:hypothetical protein
MTKDENIYVSLCVIFSVLIVTSNLIYQKFVALPVFPFYTFELSVGAILYPLTFMLTDLITEFYGKEKANFCIKLAIVMNIFIACIIVGMDQLQSTSWSRIDSTTFHKVFGLYSVAFIGSMIACYTAQMLDVIIYLWIRKITRGKLIWARNNGSTAISLFFDTFIVISFMTAFGVLPVERMWPLIINSYLFKLFFSICSTPLFYISIGIIKYLQQNTQGQYQKISSLLENIK